jgi:hypothetical protein
MFFYACLKVGSITLVLWFSTWKVGYLGGPLSKIKDLLDVNSMRYLFWTSFNVSLSAMVQPLRFQAGTTADRETLFPGLSTPLVYYCLWLVVFKHYLASIN